MTSVNIVFNKNGGDVIIEFFSGLVLSRWLGQLTTTKIQHQTFGGMNDDGIPDRIALSPAVLANDALLTWVMIVFGPDVGLDYRTTVAITQDGQELHAPITHDDTVSAGTAESVSGVLKFAGA